MLQKYFLAIVPPEPILSEIWNIKRRIFESYQTKGALRSPAHITLHMPFLFDEQKEDKLFNCLKDFKFSKTLNVVLSSYGCFEPRVVFIDVAENSDLIELQKKLVTHVKMNLGLLNQANNLRGFHPHVTVAFRDLKKATFKKVWEE
ncbi:MAG: 2-5 ligase [Bacteroidota bacterium]|nr:2-5 ligase [Bacteroidota bacterium]